MARHGNNSIALTLCSLLLANGKSSGRISYIPLEKVVFRKMSRVSARRITMFEQTGVVAVFECAGLSITTQLCLDAAPQGSSIILVGMGTEDVTLNPLRFVRNELELRGALIYEHPHDFARTIDLIASGRLAPGSTASPPQPLENLPALLEAMAAGKLGAKPLIAVRPVQIEVQ